MTRYFSGFREKGRLSENRQETAAVLRLIRKNGLNRFNGLRSCWKTMRPTGRQPDEPRHQTVGGSNG